MQSFIQLKLSYSNPWIEEVWKSIFNCTFDCEGKRLDWKMFQLDSKVDFVVDTVLALSDAIERCYADSCEFNSDDFFQNYVLTTSLHGKKSCLKSIKMIVVYYIYFLIRWRLPYRIWLQWWSTGQICDIPVAKWRCNWKFAIWGLNIHFWFWQEMHSGRISNLHFMFQKIGLWSQNGALSLNANHIEKVNNRGTCRPKCTVNQFEKFAGESVNIINYINILQ